MFSRSAPRGLTDQPRRIEAYDSITLTADVDRVWSVVTDPAVRLSEADGAAHIAPGTGPAEGIGVGSIYVIVRSTPAVATPVVSSWQVTAWEPPRAFSLVFLHDRDEVRLGVEHVIEPVARGTKLAVVGWFEMRAGVSAAKAEEITPRLRATTDRMVDGLVTYIRRLIDAPA